MRPISLLINCFRKQAFLFTFGMLVVSAKVFGQDNNLVRVNPLTGTANVMIPLYTLKAAGVSLPIELVYSASGLHANEVESSAGMGWNLTAGGSIRRQVRGLPDDVKNDIPGNPMLGLMYISTPSNIGGISIANDNLTTTYSDVATDVSHINSYFGYNDTEPDIFNISAPGLTCQLVFDAVNHLFRPIPYQDLKISYTTNGTSGPTFGEITSFTITNDKGVVYTFSATEAAMQKVVTSGANVSNYFKVTYNQYLNGISYYSGWNLTNIQDYYGNGIQIAYTTGTKKGFTNAMDVTVATPSNSAVDSLQYKLYGYNIPNLVSTINFTDGNGGNGNVFTFGWTTNTMTNKDVIYTITGLNRNFKFTYSYEAYGTTSFKRYFLSNLTDNDCSSPFNYSFKYNGETLINGNLTTTAPDSTAAGQATDLWGYYRFATNGMSYPAIAINPSTSGYDRYFNLGSQTPSTTVYPYTMTGANRSATAYNVAGTLTQINYGDGGSTTLTYQTNDYYDSNLGANVWGGGLRVISITDYDGINTANNMVRSYNYYLNGLAFDDPGAISNGKPISLPIYAFTKPYNGTGTTQALWTYSTVRSGSDLSQEDHTILYSSVIEKQTGRGKTVYTYNVPATHWDASISTPLPWSPTLAYAGCATSAATGFLNNTTNTYPFAPNLNYDFERGMIASVVNYDESNNEVSEQNYTYQTLQTPITLPGFKYDQNSFGIGYSKYSIYTTTSPLVTQMVSKVFDLNSTTLSKTSTINYTYNSTQYQLAQQSVTNSDGGMETSNTLYAKDYNTSVRTDSYTQAIYGLQQANINTPVETYFQVKPAGTSTWLTTKAQLIKFCNTCTGFTSAVLPVKKYSITSSAGISGFQASSIASGNFSYDNTDYNLVENDNQYDYTGNIMSMDDNFKHVQTIFIDHLSYKPTYVFKNANWNEVAFLDFDSRMIGSFWVNSNSLTKVTTSRSGKYGATLPLNTSQQSPTITKNTLAQSYIFSIWVQTSASGVLTATVNSGSVHNSVTQNYANTLGAPTTYPTGWQYLEVKVPLTSIGSTFTISFSTSTNATIDDVLAYPDVAEAGTIAYDPVTFFKTSETNTNGVSTYYNYDQFGRLHYMYDQDKNIVMRKQYAPGSVETAFTPPVLAGPASVYKTLTYTWSNNSVYNGCVSPGISYKWDFGDGTTPVVISTTAAQTHAYATTGTYTITLTATSPFLGTRTSTITVTVSIVTSVNITYNNYTNSSHIATVTFSQGGVVKYTFTTTQLQAGQNITPGSYSIDIHPSGTAYNSGTGNGYNSVIYSGHTTQCFSYTGADFVFTDDLTNYPGANFTMQTALCGI